MSGSNLTERELDNILASYAQYGAEHLGDYIRSIWAEAWEEAYDEGYRKGVVEGFNSGMRQKR
jgi:hypothetical protein